MLNKSSAIVESQLQYMCAHERAENAHTTRIPLVFHTMKRFKKKYFLHTKTRYSQEQ